ncbi:uncharacterized protein [Mytilus edulis]|uniref:uncharacterized protein isoform X1 n=1 Tax=Mytilus edulis TaxID=6550 RepID=UPI0039F06A86
MHCKLSLCRYLRLCTLFVLAFTTDLIKGGNTQYNVEQISSCQVKISNYGTINLKPLQRNDGFPRFSTYYRVTNRLRSELWNYSFNPCQSYNEPFDLGDKNRYGEPCMSVSICKFGKILNRQYYYTYGQHNSANFSVAVKSTDSPPIVTLTFNGTGGNFRKKSLIHLICDKSLFNPDSAVFSIKHDDLKTGIISELRHICCCPNACIDGIPTDNSTNLSVDAADDKEKKKSDSRTLLLIVALNLGLLVFAGIIGTMCYSKRSSPSIYSKLPGIGAVPSTRVNFSSIDLEKDTLEMPKSSRSSIRDYEPWAERKKQVMMPIFDDCVIPKDNIELAQRLGGGLYGDTYVGDVKGLKVAVTRITLNLHKEQKTSEMLQWLKDEVWFLSRQRHRNIVAMLGLCTDAKFPYIMSEFIEGFTVKNYIQNKGDLVSWPLRVKICLQAADGVAYLHSTKPPIIHRDLRCANLFISHHEIVQVGDFGLIKLIQPLRKLCQQEDCCCQGHICACPSSLRWTAPEVLNHPSSDEKDKFISLKSDSYSFGVCMWEVVMCEDPFDDVQTEQEVMELVKDGIRPEIPGTVDIMPQFRTLMNQCWNGEPENRLSFKQIATKLKELVSQARTFQKNILSKQKLQKLQYEIGVSDSDNVNRLKYDSVKRLHRDSESSTTFRIDSGGELVHRDSESSYVQNNDNGSLQLHRDSERSFKPKSDNGIKRYHRDSESSSILKTDNGTPQPHRDSESSSIYKTDNVTPGLRSVSEISSILKTDNGTPRLHRDSESSSILKTDNVTPQPRSESEISSILKTDNDTPRLHRDSESGSVLKISSNNLSKNDSFKGSVKKVDFKDDV